MLVSKAISRINYSLRGTDDDPPSEGTEEYVYWLDTLNRIKDQLYSDVTRTWKQTHQTRSIGTISAGVAPSFDMDSDFLAPSSCVFALSPSGARTRIEIVAPEEVDYTKRQVYFEGENPTVLYFSNAIKSTDQIVGAALYVPGYYMPADVTKSKQNIPLPDPNWGVAAVAAEIAFNDIVYEEKAPDLNSKANALWKAMVRTNQRGTYGNPRKTPTNVNRIRSASRRG